MALEGTSDENPPLTTGSAKMDDGDDAAHRRMVCCCGLAWRPTVKDNSYESPSEYEPPSERKPHGLWRWWKTSTVTVSPFFGLLLIVGIVTLIANLLATLR